MAIAPIKTVDTGKLKKLLMKARKILPTTVAIAPIKTVAIGKLKNKSTNKLPTTVAAIAPIKTVDTGKEEGCPSNICSRPLIDDRKPSRGHGADEPHKGARGEGAISRKGDGRGERVRWQRRSRRRPRRYKLSLLCKGRQRPELDHLQYFPVFYLHKPYGGPDSGGVDPLVRWPGWLAASSVAVRSFDTQKKACLGGGLTEIPVKRSLNNEIPVRYYYYYYYYCPCLPPLSPPPPPSPAQTGIQEQ